jgi:hypothetical protein
MDDLELAGAVTGERAAARERHHRRDDQRRVALTEPVEI